MAEKLVILSDLWGSKKGLWITSYLGYLQQYFDIQYYDTFQLADVDLVVCSSENLVKSFENGGLETAVKQLMNKETEPAHYLTFCCGGTVAWHAAHRGLPMKSLYTIAPMNIPDDIPAPDCPVRMLYGERDQYIPTKDWAVNREVALEVLPNYGHELYSDEKIIQKVCLTLLEAAIHKKFQI